MNKITVFAKTKITQINNNLNNILHALIANNNIIPYVFQYKIKTNILALNAFLKMT